MKKTALLLALLPAFAPAQFSPYRGNAYPTSGTPFALRNGDRVVFYGDSITDQRLYTLFTEVFVRTRFPKLDVSFVHSGWGGDTVRGGGGGDIDTRLSRDVLSYRPTVVTIMLGMNDGGYRAFEGPRFDDYAKGYAHIVDRLRREAPGVRLTLIQPSPYDDVTRPPGFPGGYNGTLLRYSDYVRQLAGQNGAMVADLNGPVVSMLQAANGKDPATAQKIIPDRVHPGDAGHLAMAAALLKAWNAPSLVSAVALDGGKVASAQNAKVTDLSTANGLAWTQLDDALPFPLNLGDPTVKLAVDAADFIPTLDQQILTVGGLTGRQTLSIDGKPVGTFSAEELAMGVNLAALDTPMRAQAGRVLDLVRNRAEAHNQAWRNVQTGWFLGGETAAAKEKADVMKAFDRYDKALDKEARKAAQPVPHRFTLTPAP